MNFESLIVFTFINSFFMFAIIMISLIQNKMHDKPIHLNIFLLLFLMSNIALFVALVDEHYDLRKAAVKFGLVQTEESVSVKKNVWKIK